MGKNIGSRQKKLGVKRQSNVVNVLSVIKKASGGMDLYFMAAVYILLAFGLLMVLSASSPIAYASSSTGNDSFYYFKKQLLWAVVGSIFMFVAANLKYETIKKWSSLALAVSIVLLVMVLIPGIGRKINDARRWIYLGPFNFQPSEVAKIGMIMFFSYSLSKNYKNLKHFSVFIMYIVIIGVVSAIIMLQPHFSCTMLIVMTAMIMLFVAGAKLSHFGLLAVPAVLGIGALIIKAPYRLARVTTFMDPFKDIQGSGWQIVQSLYAIGSGGIFGAGLGQSRQKYMNIPEPQNDFIFSILAEEFGLFGTILVIALFTFLIVRGVKIALNAPDLFGTLITTGIITMIAIQALVNIAVVTSSIPVTGMPLPFFSYGGTALAITLVEMGIVLNVSRQGKR